MSGVHPSQEFKTKPSARLDTYGVVGAALVAVASSFIVMPTHWKTYWKIDFPTFWFAAQRYLSGHSPYDAGHVALGNSLALGVEIHPFYYPPALLPILAPLGALDLENAGKVMFILNVGLICTCTALLGPRLRTPVQTPMQRSAVQFIPALCLTALSIPAIQIVAYGQVTLLFLLGLLMLRSSSALQRPWLGSLGLAILLCKPHFGLPVLLFAALKRETRSTVPWGILIYVLLSLAGSAPDVVAAIAGFLRNISVYQNHPSNDPQWAQGFNLLLLQFGLKVPTAFAFAATLAWATFIARRVRGSTEVQIALVIAGALLFLPSHTPDLILLSVALGAIVQTDTLRGGLLRFAAFLFVGQAAMIATLLPPGQIFATYPYAIATMNTLSILIVVAALFATVYPHRSSTSLSKEALTP